MPYVLRRLAQAIVVLWGAITLSFLIVHLVPGDPARIMLGVGSGDGGATVSDAEIASVRADLGLDQPVLVQYGAFLLRILQGDLGTSYSAQRPVIDVVATALPPTIELGVVAVVIAVLLGVGIAVVARLVPSVVGSLLQSASVLGLAVPSYWIAIVLMQVFSFTLGWFPAFGAGSPAAVVLPALSLALVTAGTITQVLGRGLDEAMLEGYADAARARGASRARVLLEHALRNASLPVLTIVGLMVGGILSGATIVETIYGRPGLGSVIVDAITARDFPLIQALVILSGGLFVVVTLAVDLLYRRLDPRLAAPGVRA